MNADKSADERGPDETKRRMDDAIRRALNTPPKPHSELTAKGKRGKGKPKSRVKKARQ